MLLFRFLLIVQDIPVHGRPVVSSISLTFGRPVGQPTIFFPSVPISFSFVTDGKHHMLPGSGDLYIYGVDKSDTRAAYRCRTQHRLPGIHQQLSSNAVSISVSGEKTE